jgi:hypothetical protein
MNRPRPPEEPDDEEEAGSPEVTRSASGSRDRPEAPR